MSRYTPNPITSRVKRAPLKQTARSYGSIEGIDQTEIKDPNVSSSTYTCDQAVADGAYKTKKECLDAVYERTGSYNPTAEGIEDNTRTTETCPEGFTKNAAGKCEKVTEGEDIEYDTNIQTKTTGTMLQPWQVRRQLRSQTRANRQINKYERKMGKYGSFDMEGNFTPNSNLSERDMRKLRQYQRGLTSAKEMEKNVAQGIDFGKKAGQSFFSGTRDVEIGERTPEQQLEQSKQEALKFKRAMENAAKNDIVTSSTGTSGTSEPVDVEMPEPITITGNRSADAMELNQSMEDYYKQMGGTPKSSGLKYVMTPTKVLQNGSKIRKAGALKKNYFKK
tara:strand:+ start:28 stop:1032 length:1005 start_codon:yes stop_codon:yes gene_type:complete